jgi:hypothetical protein
LITLASRIRGNSGKGGKRFHPANAIALNLETPSPQTIATCLFM